MTQTEILTEIYKENLQVEIYDFLHKEVLRLYQKEQNENAQLNACLTAIRKINKGRNDAIDALCE